MGRPVELTPSSNTKPKVKLMVVGPPGSGKTRLACSSRRPLIIRPPTDSIESALSAGLSFTDWEVDNWSTMDEVLEYCRHEGFKKHDWFWLDSGSLMQEVLLDDVFADAVARKPARGEFGPDKGEYGVNMYRFSKWVRHMAAIPGVNFGMTAYPFETTDEDGELIKMPWIQGRNMPAKMCGYMNVVGNLVVVYRKKEGTKKRERVEVLVTEPHDGSYAKDQFNAFGGKVISPTIPKMEAAMKAAVSGRTGKTPAKKRRTTTRRRTTS